MNRKKAGKTAERNSKTVPGAPPGAPVAGAATASLAVAIVCGFSLLAAASAPAAQPLPLLSFAVLSFTACLMLLFMALRKFGNNETGAASRIVKKANLFAIAGFLLALFSLAQKLGESGTTEGTAAGTALAAAALAVFAWLAWFGKKTMKYW